MINCLDANAPVTSSAVFKALQLIDDAQSSSWSNIKLVALGLAKCLKANGLRLCLGEVDTSELGDLVGNIVIPIKSDDGEIGAVQVKWTDRGNRANSRDLSFIPCVAPLLAG